MSLCFYSFTKSRRRTVIPLTRSCSFRFVKQTLLPTNISYKTKELNEISLAKRAKFVKNFERKEHEKFILRSTRLCERLGTQLNIRGN